MLSRAEVIAVALAALLFCSSARSASESDSESGELTAHAGCERASTTHTPRERWHLQLTNGGVAVFVLRPSALGAQSIDPISYTRQLDQLLERPTPQYSVSF